MKNQTLKCIIALLLLALLGGCASLADIRAWNRQNLLQLSTGASKADVLRIMGTDTISAEGSVITNPYRSELYRSEARTVELMLYYTDIKKADGAITDDELTPIVLIDGRVDGWGWSYWDAVVKKYEIRVR